MTNINDRPSRIINHIQPYKKSSSEQDQKVEQPSRFGFQPAYVHVSLFHAPWLHEHYDNKVI
jgi:hypothetical protein